MDPTACLREMLEAWADGEPEEAMDRLDDLRGWLRGGGFSPHVKRLTSLVGGETRAWIVG